MRLHLPPRALPLVALLLTACASHTKLAPEVRSAVERDLSGPDARRFLKLSMNVTPFFGDATRRLLTPWPPDEVRLLDDTTGKPLSPGAVQAVLPAGARARIVGIEFPTAWALTERVLYSPRTFPWVTVEVEGAPPGPPLTLVLRGEFTTREQVLAEVDRFLVLRDPAPQLAALAEPVRQAVREKKAVEDMPAEALEMAWGYPERIHVEWVERQRHETWTYPGGRRVAKLVDGRVRELPTK